MERMGLSVGLYLCIVASWSLYRATGSFPESVDELVAKPLLMLLPTLLAALALERKRLRDLGISNRHWARNTAIGIGVGLALLAEKYAGQGWTGTIRLSDMARLGYTPLLAVTVPLATAVTEEVVYRGYFFTRLRDNGLGEWASILVSSLLFVGVHVPLAVVSRQAPGEFAAYGAMLFVLSCILGFTYSRTRSIVAPVIIHWMWNAAFFLR